MRDSVRDAGLETIGEYGPQVEHEVQDSEQDAEHEAIDKSGPQLDEAELEACR